MRIQEHDLFATDEPRRFKIFFVEIDDDNRERVISAVAQRAEFKMNNEYNTIYSDAGATLNIPTMYTAELELKLVPSEDGTLFKWENFADEEEE